MLTLVYINNFKEARCPYGRITLSVQTAKELPLVNMSYFKETTLSVRSTRYYKRRQHYAVGKGTNLVPFRPDHHPVGRRKGYGFRDGVAATDAAAVCLQTKIMK